MTDRPILFSAPMVRAILAGTKTQTRRVAPVDSLDITENEGGSISWAARFSQPVRSRVSGARATGTYSGGRFTREQAASIIAADYCPYGQPGDRLWVRETFARIDGQTRPWIETDYRATYTHGDRLGDLLGIKKRWTPSIHMPRHASRITLAIAGVRVERLQAISEADALAEGIEYSERFNGYCIGMAEHFNSHDPRQSYLSLWEAINGPGSVEANPWVWVVEFKRLPIPSQGTEP